MLFVTMGPAMLGSVVNRQGMNRTISAVPVLGWDGAPSVSTVVVAVTWTVYSDSEVGGKAERTGGETRATRWPPNVCPLVGCRLSEIQRQLWEYDRYADVDEGRAWPGLLRLTKAL